MGQKERALFVPRDRDDGFVRWLLGIEPDGVAAAQNGRDDLRREGAEAQEPGGAGAGDAGLGGELIHGFAGAVKEMPDLQSGAPETGQGPIG